MPKRHQRDRYQLHVLYRDGVAFLYVDEQYFDGVPIEEAWMGRDGAEDFSRLAEFTDVYQAGARRFDAGEKSSFSNIAGALAVSRDSSCTWLRSRPQM